MTTLRMFRLVIVGSLAGALLAMATPQPALTKKAGVCRCSDEGTGNYRCSGDHSACVAGSEACSITCV